MADLHRLSYSHPVCKKVHVDFLIHVHVQKKKNMHDYMYRSGISACTLFQHCPCICNTFMRPLIFPNNYWYKKHNGVHYAPV